MLQSVQAALLKSGVLSVACCVLTVSAVHADVYKYKDEKGNVLYTDKPMFLPAEKISIKTETSNIVDLNRESDDKKSSGTDSTRKATPAAAKGKSEDSADKATACEKARQDYLARMNARRLYEEKPDGERTYLTEQEIEAARTTAKQAMDSVCG